MSDWIKTTKGLFLKLKFESPQKLKEFTAQLAKIADTINHHPDYEHPNETELDIYLLTHSANAITQKDYELAGKIDELLNR